MLYANQWPKYFVKQQYTTLTFTNFRRPILRSRVIYKPFQKIVEEISIVRFTTSKINNLITSYSAFIDLSFFSYMMHTSSEERSPRVMVIYWEIRHEATESLQQINGLLISADMIFGINTKMRNRYLLGSNRFKSNLNSTGINSK